MNRFIEMSPFFLLVLNFFFGRVFGFPVTAGTFISILGLILFACYGGGNIRLLLLMVSLFLLGYQLALSLFFQGVEVGAFLQFFYFLFFLVFLTGFDFNKSGFNHLKYIRNMKAVLWVVSIGTIVQFFLMNVLGSFIFQNPFSIFSHPGPGGEVYIPWITAEFKRPNLFYYEPSVLSWILVFLISMVLFFEGRVVVSVLLGSLAVFLCGALTGIIGLLLVVLIFSYGRFKGMSKTLLVLFVPFLLCIFGWISMNYGYVEKVMTIFDEGTSVYYRLYAPYLLNMDSWNDGYYFGHVLGSENYVISKSYMVNTDGGSSTNIDNTFYYLIFYFGFLGYLFLLFYIVLGFFSRTRLLWAGFLVVICSTGAIFSPNITLVLFLVFVSRKVGFRGGRYE